MIYAISVRVPLYLASKIALGVDYAVGDVGVVIENSPAVAFWANSHLTGRVVRELWDRTGH